MIGSLMGDDAVIVRPGIPGEPDRFGHRPSAAPTRQTVRARVEQTGTQEGEEFVVNRWVGYFAADADIRSDDLVEFRGLRLQVDGAAALRSVPGFPALTHVMAHLNYLEDV